MTWACLFGHSTTLNGRNDAGQLIRVCERCHQSLGVVLGGEMLAGPQKDQAPILGRPNTRVTRQLPANVAEWKRSAK